jgi:hypothetical protein
VTIKDAGSALVSATLTATVTDAPLAARGLNTLVGIRGAPFFGVIASFTDADTSATPQKFTATIAWGDGQMSAGTVAANSSGAFDVSGSNIYTHEGPYPVTVQITDAGGSAASAHSTVHVGRTGSAPEHLTAVANCFTHSQEYYTQITTAAYLQYLHRFPDPAGLIAWVNAFLNHGLTDERLEAFFISSTEYINDHGGRGKGWVVGVYRDLLGRDPDPAGLQSWLHALQSGMPPFSIAYGFAASVERETNRIMADYRNFLARDPEPGTVPIWLNALVHGASNEAVVAGFVGSTEYFVKHYSNVYDWVFAAYQDTFGRPPDKDGRDHWIEILGSE